MTKLDLSRAADLFAGSATFTPPPALTMRGPVSFSTDNPAGLAGYLVANGYDLEPARSPYEWGRAWFCGALVVIYHSGTALIQGKPEPSLALLGGLVDGGAK